jgi:hypothetical protein
MLEGTIRQDVVELATGAPASGVIGPQRAVARPGVR